MHALKDKVALITGGANGIGAAVVREFLKGEVKHIAILDINESAGNTIKNEAAVKYGQEKVRFFKCDVTNDEQLFAAYSKTVEYFGAIDVVVNSAGIANESPNSYKREININFTATVTSTFKALELMRVDKGGKGGTIINTSSIAALTQHSPGLFVYGATKSAILHFSNCIGMEEYYRYTKVRVLTVCFGATETGMAGEVAGIDEITTDGIKKWISSLKDSEKCQSAKEAAEGVVVSYKNGVSGSTWLVEINKVSDITDNIKKAFNIMSNNVSI